MSSIHSPIRFYEFKFNMFNLNYYTQNQLYTKFNKVLHDWDDWKGLEWGYDNKVNNLTSNNKVQYMQAYIKLGAPLYINDTRYKSKEDWRDDQDVFIE